MAVEQKLRAITVPASADLSADQYHFVSVNSDGQLALTGAGAAAHGVLQDKPTAQGEAAELGVPGGVSKVVAGAAVNAGAELAADSTGRGVTATTGDFVAGIALEAAAAANVVISVLLTSPFKI